VYVPTIVREILNDPGPINLKGFAVGDGCMGTEVLCGGAKKGPFYEIEFMHGHGQVSERLYRTIKQACPEQALRTGTGMSAACTAAVARMKQSLGGLFGYSLYDDCIYDEGFRRRKLGGLNDYACPGDAMTRWLNLPEVRESLHIQPSNRFNSADNGVGMNYTSSEPNVLPIYERARQLEGLRVLVYNGDTDPAINSMITQDKYTAFFDSIGVKETEAWRPWTLDGRQRMGGYVTTWAGPSHGFQFLTIRGSGHMVPEYKPAATLAFLTAFVRGDDFPDYVAPPPSASRTMAMGSHGRSDL